MENEKIDIVYLIEKNPLTRLSKEYQSKFIDKIKNSLTESQQNIFVGSFYCYLNYKKEDYVIDLDNVWKWLGFERKSFCKKVLDKHFIKDIDYKIKENTYESSEEKAATPVGEAAFKNLGGAGKNKETILMNINTFKKLCLKSNTKKADELHDYFIKSEEILQEIINEESNELKLQLQEKEEQLDNTNKLLEEKEKCIAQMKDLEFVSILYIGHNPVIKNVHKIGISSRTKTNDILVRKENHNSSNPGFDFLFTFETPKAKLIEDLVKLLLKPFKLIKPEWYSINYNQMKKIVDFCIMMYEEYCISDSVENICEFVSRYRSNRLVNTNKARVLIEKNIYNEYIEQNIVYGSNLKVSTEFISNDFYDWYKEKYQNKIDNNHIKLETGNFSTEFQKEITKTISNITGMEYTNGLSLSDQKRGLYFSNSSGFRGIELKTMSLKKAEFFDDIVFTDYINKFITITNNPRHKVARVEIIEDFLIYVKSNNYISKTKIYSRTNVTNIFKENLIEKIEHFTKLKLTDTNKINYNGCFIGMIHCNFDCIGKETHSKPSLSDNELIKNQVDSWIKEENNTAIAEIFKQMLKNGNKLNINEIKLIYNKRSYVDITLNKRKHKWYLVFDKSTNESDEIIFFIKNEALVYFETLNKNEN